jgi:DNA-binding LacI/PurR family transcriptional regulator
MTVVGSFRERRVDGIVVASSRVGSLYMSVLGEMQIPIVLLNNQSPGSFAHAVTIDNVDGALQAARHLVQLGHRNIAYLGDRFGLQSDAERLKGYRKGLEEAGLPFSGQLVVSGDGKTSGARQAAAHLLSPILPIQQRPTAVFCYNDMSALGVMQEADAIGLRIPRDLSIVGFDDLFFASQLRPPLTTVRQPKKEIGRRAMAQLLALIRGEQAGQTILIKGELVMRESTARPLSPTPQSVPTRGSGRGKTRTPSPRSKA